MAEKQEHTILVIDDEAIIRRNFKGYLEDEGYRTLITDDGHAALGMLERERVDLVLVDLRMPKMDGLEVLARVKQTSPDTPVIVVSGTGRLEDAVEALRLGAGDYLLKPVEDMSILSHTVEKAFERTRLIRENREHQQHLEQLVAERTAELKAALKKIEKNEKFLSTIIENIPDMIFVKDARDLRFVRFNKAGEDLLGYSRDELIGKRDHEIFSQQTADAYIRKDREVLDKKSLIDVAEECIQTKDKGERILHTKKIPILNENGQPEYLMGISEDVTERKSRDKQIRLLQHWVKHSEDLFFWVRKDSQVLYINQAVCVALGYTHEELVSMKVADFDLGLPVEAWPDFAKKLIQQGSLCFESRLQGKNGQIFPVEITANVLRFEGEDHFFAYGRDISARVSAEEKSKKLESLLRQAQKMEAIGTLAGGIAHDFNNILSAIIGFTEISIRDVPPGSKLEENLQRVLNAGMRAAGLVKQILTFSRQTDRVVKPIQVQSIATEALKLLRASLPATIDIHQEITSESPIMADPTQIHQIIMNLCTNAAHAMRDKGGRLAVRLTDEELGADLTGPHPDMAPGLFIKLSVSDSGPGIAPEIRERIFDPFFTTKELGEGTGLGLSMVHGIVKDCGGMVSVESAPGKGSTFDVFFPVIESMQGAEMVTHATLPSGSERILFVDDEPDQVEMGKRVLELLGYHVTAKTGAQEALQAFRATPDAFDLVITDMTMPMMTGDDLAKAIMRIRSDVPVILCTGYSAKITPEKASALGIKELIMKPAVVEEIARAVRRVLDQKKID